MRSELNFAACDVEIVVSHRSLLSHARLARGKRLKDSILRDATLRMLNFVPAEV